MAQLHIQHIYGGHAQCWVHGTWGDLPDYSVDCGIWCHAADRTDRTDSCMHGTMSRSWVMHPEPERVPVLNVLSASYLLMVLV